MIQNWLNMPSQLQGIESQSETRFSKGSNTLWIQVPYSLISYSTFCLTSLSSKASWILFEPRLWKGSVKKNKKEFRHGLPQFFRPALTLHPTLFRLCQQSPLKLLDMASSSIQHTIGGYAAARNMQQGSTRRAPHKWLRLSSQAFNSNSKSSCLCKASWVKSWPSTEGWPTRYDHF